MNKYFKFIEEENYEQDIPFWIFLLYSKTHKGFDPDLQYKIYWIIHNKLYEFV